MMIKVIILLTTPSTDTISPFCFLWKQVHDNNNEHANVVNDYYYCHINQQSMDWVHAISSHFRI